MTERSRAGTGRLAIVEIADAHGDVDRFIDQYDEQTQKAPKIAAAIAGVSWGRAAPQRRCK